MAEQAPWIEHNGGGRPNRPSDWVEVEFRDRQKSAGYSALYMWPWLKSRRKASDILRWRPAIRPPTVEEAARVLVAKLDECQPHIDDAFVHRSLHCGTYTGPTYGAELSALKRALESAS